MLELNNPTKRKTRGAYAVLTRKQIPIVVTLEPGDVLTFRHLRCRSSFSLPIESAFRVAVRYDVEARRRAKGR